jgi:hypothetical protein
MSFWQTKNWKNLLLKSNQATQVFELEWIFIEKRSIWLWEYWLFALWISEKQKINEEKLIELCKKENCLFVQIETFEIPLSQPFPPREKGVFFSPRPWGDKWRKECLHDYPEVEVKQGLGVREWYYKKFITPFTALVDLSKTLDEILALMKPKWRYNIWLARKKWVEVFECEKNEENIKIFYELMLETTSRDNFAWNSLDYYKTFLEEIENSSLIFTKFEWKILSAWIFVFDEDLSIYYYWASTSDKEYRNLMAPYLMQFYAIEKAKKFGSKYYDFLWVATPWDEKSHLLWVTDFKLKFTQDVREVSKSYIFVNKKFKYFIFQILRKVWKTKIF